MTSKAFSILLLFSLVLGIALGAAFAGGFALGKSRGLDQSQGSASLRPPSDFQGEGSRDGGRESGFRGRSPSGDFRHGEAVQPDRDASGQRGDRSSSNGAGPSPGDGEQDLAARQEFFGSIVKLQDGVMTLDSPQGQVQAAISESTAIQKTVAGSVDGLVLGAAVRILGRRVEDGPVQARSITLVPEGSGGSSGPAGGGVSLFGTIERIEDGLVTVAAPDGPLQVAVANDTTIRKLEPGSRADLVEGAAVRITGSPDEEGKVQASLIILVPEGADRFSRRGSRDREGQPR